jgi:fluoride exporter
MGHFVAICVGGAVGTGARYVASVLAVRWFGSEFPYGTLIVNVVGSFLIGVIQEIASRTVLVPEGLRLFLTVGIMGGLTTYSSFSYETIRLVQVGAWGRASGNVLGTTVLCLAACVLGVAVGRAFGGTRP